MKSSGHFRRLVPPRRGLVRPLASDVVEQLPLGNPVGAHPWAVRLELPVQVIELAFEHFGPLIELELSKTLRQDGLHLIERVSLEEIQHHRIADHELAVDGLGLTGEEEFSIAGVTGATTLMRVVLSPVSSKRTLFPLAKTAGRPPKSQLVVVLMSH